MGPFRARPQRHGSPIGRVPLAAKEDGHRAPPPTVPRRLPHPVRPLACAHPLRPQSRGPARSEGSSLGWPWRITFARRLWLNRDGAFFCCSYIFSRRTGAELGSPGLFDHHGQFLCTHANSAGHDQRASSDDGLAYEGRRTGTGVLPLRFFHREARHLGRVREPALVLSLHPVNSWCSGRFAIARAREDVAGSRKREWGVVRRGGGGIVTGEPSAIPFQLYAIEIASYHLSDSTLPLFRLSSTSSETRRLKAFHILSSTAPTSSAVSEPLRSIRNPLVGVVGGPDVP
jgi:hypothetical protein